MSDPWKSHPSTTTFTIFGLLLLAWIVFPFASVMIYDVGTAVQWNGMTARPIDALQDSSIVKIRGFVNSTRPVALSGTEHWFGDEYGGEWKWRWNTSDTFWVEDGTGRVLVDCAGYYRIEKSHHKAPNARYSGGTAYFVNDTVYVIGTIQTEGTTRTFHLLCMYPSDTQLELPLWWAFLAALILGMFIEVCIWSCCRSRRRMKLHALTTRDILPSPLPPSGFEFEINIPKQRRNVKRFCQALLIGATVIAVYILMAMPHTAEDMGWLAMIVSFTMSILWMSGVVFLFDIDNRPAL